MRRIATLTLLATCAAHSGCSRPTGLEAPPGPAVAGSQGVVFVEEPWIEGGCGRWCLEPYRSFPERHLGGGPPLTRRQLDALLDASFALPDPRPTGASRQALRTAIVDALGLGPLLDGLTERALAVAVLDETASPGMIRRKLLLWDPLVGSFEGLLLLPDGPGPHPAVVGLHGHRHDDERIATDYLGADLAEAGFAVLMPRLRANDCSLSEYRIARRLLRHGASLMGLRIYETLLMAKLLDGMDQVNGERVGLLGHSGGSNTADLVVRVSDRFAAQATDVEGWTQDYRNQCGLLGDHCETVPGLVALAADVHDESTFTLPRLQAPYRFRAPEDRNRIIAFFETHLGAGGEKPPAQADREPRHGLRSGRLPGG